MKTRVLGRFLDGVLNGTPLVKVGWVAGGYIGALTLGVAAVAIHRLGSRGLGTQGSGGMNAFAETLLFFWVFALAAAPSTVAALILVRRFREFWAAFSAVVALASLTAVAAFVAWAAGPRSVAGGLAGFRIFAAPLFAPAFLLFGIFAPNRSSRITLFFAAALEAIVFAGWVITCLVRNL